MDPAVQDEPRHPRWSPVSKMDPGVQNGQRCEQLPQAISPHKIALRDEDDYDVRLEDVALEFLRIREIINLRARLHANSIARRSPTVCLTTERGAHRGVMLTSRKMEASGRGLCTWRLHVSNAHS